MRTTQLVELLLLVRGCRVVANPVGFTGEYLEDVHPSYRNAFHIFNAIHSSMRQWGSSLNHNGMSFFPTLVPAGTELYHGTSKSEPVEGMEWLAFEPEHAQQFARRFGGRPGGPGGPGGGERPPPPPPLPMFAEQMPLELREWKDLDGPPEPPQVQSGFLHTYLAKKDLQLLYIDGMSAGKTNNGTLDSQDYLLLNDTSEHPGMWERERAQGMCNISRDEWGGRVDGFLRMEAGFEIILCHFDRDLEVKSIGRANGECKGCSTDMSSTSFNYLRAVGDRYHGIGGERVKVNFEKMVTVYTLDTDLFVSGERGPRLKDVSQADLKTIRAQVDAMVLSDPNPFTHTGANWQAVTDVIVTRYSSRLKYLSLPGITDNEELLNSALNALVSLFIDYDNRSFINETSRCASHFMRSSGVASSLAEHVITYVSHYICNKLLSMHYGEVADSLVEKQKIIHDLIEKLSWTTWKECGPCGYDEICSIPIWPFGSEEDWQQPKCRNATTVREQSGYWGNRGPGGRRPPRGNRTRPW